jgi:hypothetical protein
LIIFSNQKSTFRTQHFSPVRSMIMTVLPKAAKTAPFPSKPYELPVAILNDLPLDQLNQVNWPARPELAEWSERERIASEKQSSHALRVGATGFRNFFLALTIRQAQVKRANSTVLRASIDLYCRVASQPQATPLNLIYDSKNYPQIDSL